MNIELKLECRQMDADEYVLKIHLKTYLKIYLKMHLKIHNSSEKMNETDDRA